MAPPGLSWSALVCLGCIAYTVGPSVMSTQLRPPCPWEPATQILCSVNPNQSQQEAGLMGRSLGARQVLPICSKTELNSRAYRVCDSMTHANVTHTKPRHMSNQGPFPLRSLEMASGKKQVS